MTAEEFKQVRKQMGKTQSQMAEYLGVSQEMVSQIETGSRQVPQEIATKLGSAGMFGASSPDTNYGKPLSKPLGEKK